MYSLSISLSLSLILIQLLSRQLLTSLDSVLLESAFTVKWLCLISILGSVSTSLSVPYTNDWQLSDESDLPKLLG